MIEYLLSLGIKIWRHAPKDGFLQYTLSKKVTSVGPDLGILFIGAVWSLSIDGDCGFGDGFFSVGSEQDVLAHFKTYVQNWKESELKNSL